VFVLVQPQDLVNIALVVRAMKNMGLLRLRLVAPAEFDATRITGIAHDTHDLVSAIQITDTLDEAIAGSVHVAALTARRRAYRRRWSAPAEAAPRLLEKTVDGEVALLFGREDRGLPNSALDRSHEAISIPTSPAHPSINLGQAAMIVAYELRQAAGRALGLQSRNLAGKPRNVTPPVTAGDLEEFYAVWRPAMETIGLLVPGHPTADIKMQSFRRIFQRTGVDQRELRLLKAAAYRVIQYANRVRGHASFAQGTQDGEGGAPQDASAAGESDDGRQRCGCPPHQEQVDGGQMVRKAEEKGDDRPAGGTGQQHAGEARERS